LKFRALRKKIKMNLLPPREESDTPSALKNLKISSSSKKTLASALEKYCRVLEGNPRFYAYEIYASLELGISLEKILEDLKNFKPHQEWHINSKENDYINDLCAKRLEKPSNIVKGVYKCSRCKCDEFFVTSKQTRSGDEGETVFAKCSKCNKIIKN